ncbi:uncharacterized protein LOC125025194 [Penaeus chinensis]|uniref:uncharacterized protein LOC125025194 n=1 Tax=Penaeus chinensis TaxID=139456 RepID=UPI001FB5D925|nr:uncharacterized protein LOC125025194 [Penaeus chinensis]
MEAGFSKTEYMTTDGKRDQQNTIQLDGVSIKRVKSFKYLRAMTELSGEMDTDVNHRVQSGGNNWMKVTGVICDRRVPIRLKGKVYREVVRPAVTYGLGAAALKQVEEKKLDVTEMKMLRWMSGVTLLDRISNEDIRGSVKAVEISKKVQEARLRWVGHLKER